MNEFYKRTKRLLKPLLSGIFTALAAITATTENGHAQTYCTTSVGTNSNIYYKDSVRTTGGVTNIVHLNNSPIVVNSNGYTDLTATQVVSGLQGSSFQLNLHGRQLYSYHWNVFIDWNQNGSFNDPGEVVYSYLTGTQIQTTSVTINIPVGATPGTTRMRVGMYRISTTADPCYVGTSVMGYITDFTVDVISLTPCTNPAAGGTATVSPSGVVCPGSPLTLGLSGISFAANQTYEWESSPNNTTYTSIGAASNNPNATVTPPASTWYRCKVVCSGGTPAYSTPVQVALEQPLNGIYTINNANPTAGNNFNNFTDAINRLNCAGVSGQVTFNVSPGTPYVETLNFGNINGVSAADHVRFNGNGAIVQFNNTTSERQLLTLDGTSHVTLDSLVFRSLNATFGWGARIAGGAAFDTITRCFFDMTSVTSTVAANNNGILFTGSPTATTTSGVNGKNIYIANNHIKGSGAAGGLNFGIGIAAGGSDSNIIKNNIIENFYNNGIYISAAKATIVEGNEIHKADKTAGIVAGEGIHTVSGDMSGSRIIGNRIHSPGGTVGATTVFRGISLLGDGTATDPILVANNVIYKMNQGGASSGIYVSAGLYNLIYHNTVSFDQVLGGTAANYGIYTTGANTGTDIANNLVSITAGTGGIKYGFYYNTAPSVNDAQKNNFYLNSSQAGTQNYGYYTTAYANQAAFQAAYPTLEVGSPVADPQFTAPLTGNFLPGNNTLFVAGTNLSSLVPTDINNILRSVTPTIGAYEALPTNLNDAAATAILNPTGLFCSGTRPVEAVIRNAGANNINSLQINWSVNGTVQSPVAYSSLLVPSFVSGGQSMDTVILGNANFISGPNVIKVWTSLPNGVPDTDVFNDSVETNLSTTNFIANALSNTTCANAQVNISLDPGTGYTSETIEWQSSTDGTTWTTITGATSPMLNVTGISQSTHFRANITNNGIVCASSSDLVTVVSPSITSTTPDERCGPGVLNLTAAGSTATINWYAAATGGSPLHTGANFTTPSIAATTTYYAAASTSGGSTGGTVGKLTHSPSPTSGAGTTNFGLVFDVLAPCILDSVTIFPISASSASGSVIIDVIDGTGAILHTATVNVTGAPIANPVGQRVGLGFNLLPGTNLKLRPRSYTGITGLAFDPAANAPGGNYGYPFVLPGLVSINHSTLTAAPANTTRLDLYYYFYNWLIRTPACESARVPVIATINPTPDVDLGNDLDLCPNENVVIDATSSTPGVTYLWNNNATTPSITVSSPGTYSVTVDDGNCTAQDNITVTAAPAPVAVLNDSVSICDGDMTTLDAGNAGASYAWNDNSTTQTIDVTSGGLYTVSITNSFNCSIEDSTFVVVNALPIVDLGNDTMVCAGTSLVLDAKNPGASYTWNTGDQTQTLGISQGGTYSVVVTNADNCSASDQITIEEFTPASVDGFTFVPKFEVQQGMVDFFPINPVFADSFHWDFGDGNTSDLETPTHIYAANGNYLVTLTIINECGSMDTALLINVDLFVGVRNVSKADIRVNVYPVPSSDVLNIEVADGSTKIRSLKIVNAIGQEVFQSKNINRKDTKVELNNFAEGNYFIYIETENGNAFRKFSILR